MLRASRNSRRCRRNGGAVERSASDGIDDRRNSRRGARDEDRERVTQELQHHFEMGRLTMDDLRSRLDVTLGAITVGDLFCVTQDLPRA